MTQADLLIIGSGPGGYKTAEAAAARGLSVVVFEKAEAGGTCLNCGCIPTKALCRNAEVIETLRDADTYGITGAEGFAIDFAKIAARKQSIVEALRGGVEALMQKPGISYVRAAAAFKNATTVVADGEEYTAKDIIIATGSHAAMPPIKGIDSPSVMTSTELLDTDHVPARLCIVGAGVIGMEMACAFAAFGSKVVVVEFLKECLPALDADLAKRLRKSLEKRGVEFFMQGAVQEIAPAADGLAVSFLQKGKEKQTVADAVLIATGRAANTEGLNLEAAGVEYTRKGIATDDDYATSVPHIYAIGDVNGRQMLAHAATMQGRRVLNRITGRDDTICFQHMPAAVFTTPELAAVGLTEQACKDAGRPCKCYKGYYRANGKALAMNETEGLVKVVAAEDGTLLGAHVLGAHAADMVQEMAALLHSKATVGDLADIICTHPTLAEVMHDAVGE